ncbi:MAG: ATP-binding protein [Nitrospiraceae bacterium]|nr:MAG: ATP-binding protein [Nitrospiraceae bacterium]
MKDSTIITIPSHPKYLSVVRAVSVKMTELHGLSAAEAEDIKLAVDEACSNVIKHAYEGDTGKRIVVRFRFTKSKLEVVIEDSGKMHPEYIAGRNLDDVRPGGLGVHLIRRAFDVVAFDEKKKKGNRLILTRYTKNREKHED